MTYRQDSDFYTPYGKIEPILPLPGGVTVEPPPNVDEFITAFGEENQDAEYLKHKNLTIAWFVSNCPTPR